MTVEQVWQSAGSRPRGVAVGMIVTPDQGGDTCIVQRLIDPDGVAVLVARRASHGFVVSVSDLEQKYRLSATYYPGLRYSGRWLGAAAEIS